MRSFVVLYYTGLATQVLKSYTTLRAAEDAAEAFRHHLYQGGIEEFTVWVEAS